MQANVNTRNTTDSAAALTVSAWVLTLSSSHKAAVSQFEIIHIQENPQLVFIPASPEHCQHVMIWRDSLIPVIDFTRIHTEAQNSAPVETAKHSLNILAILRYFDAAKNDFSFGAVRLQQPPVLTVVDNTLGCPVDAIPDKLRHYSISGFYDQQQCVVPVLDVKTLFNVQSL